MGDEKNWNTLQWYVVHTHPRQEDRAISNLSAWKVETFTPRFKERRLNQFSGRPTYLIKPLFPRYIFVRFKLVDLYHKIRYTRGVHSLVTFNDKPTAVDDNLISILRSRIGKDGFIQMEEELKPGDEVIIQEGPFVGFSGIFEREMKEVDRIMILLKTVSYQAHVMVDKEKVRRPFAQGHGP